MSKKKTGRDASASPYRTRARSADRSDRDTITVSELMQDIMSDPKEIEAPRTDNSSRLTLGLMRELMREMVTDINDRIDRKIDEVKVEVGQIKSKFERFDEKFDEVHKRISDVEDKMVEVTTFETEFHAFKKNWNETLTQLQLDQCRARKNNIIFHGIVGGDKDTKKALQTFLDLCTNTLKMPKEWVEAVDVNECYHFPSKGGNGNWPLFVSLAKSRHREDIFKAAHHLKGTKIYMRNDLAPFLVERRNDLLKDQTTLRADPHKFDTKMRDTPFKVWLEFQRPNSTKWETWKGKL